MIVIDDDHKSRRTATKVGRRIMVDMLLLIVFIFIIFGRAETSGVAEEVVGFKSLILNLYRRFAKSKLGWKTLSTSYAG